MCRASRAKATQRGQSKLASAGGGVTDCVGVSARGVEFSESRRGDETTLFDPTLARSLRCNRANRSLSSAARRPLSVLPESSCGLVGKVLLRDLAFVKRSAKRRATLLVGFGRSVVDAKLVGASLPTWSSSSLWSNSMLARLRELML